MKFFKLLWMIPLCASTLLLRADDSAEKVAAPTSLAARNAGDKCDKAIADADKVFQKAVFDAKFKMNIDLRKAQQNALKDGNQEEAVAIAVKIKHTEDELDESNPSLKRAIKPFELVSARFGLENRWTDITAKLRPLIKDNGLRIPQNIPDALGADPAVGVVKFVDIVVKIHGVPVHFVACDYRATDIGPVKER